MAYQAASPEGPLVLKILTQNVDSDDDNGDSDEFPTLPIRFAREISLLGDIKSPHMAELLSEPKRCRIGAHDYIWYSEKHYSGGTLRDAINRGEHSEDLANRVLRALAGVVDLLWNDRSIVHRDIKPDNIIFDSAGTPVLIDFGISYFGDLEDITHSSAVSPRTICYAAPEQFIVRKNATIDFRTDLFQIGIVAFETLTGSHPFWFPGIDESTYHRRLNSFTPQVMQGIACNEPLRSVLPRLLASAMNRRYRTTQQFVKALDTQR